jgi:hypothetical protein
VQEISFRDWLRVLIQKYFNNNSVDYPLVIWCDPDNLWKDILKNTVDETFELWSETDNELILKHRLHQADSKPRVVYIPVKEEELSFLRVYADNAIEVVEMDLLEALLQYGAPIPSEKQSELKPNLPGYIKSWFDEPRSKWNEIQSGDEGVLITPEKILQTLSNIDFEELKSGDKFQIFRGIVTENYGLPDPTEGSQKEWRIKSVSFMICSEAYSINPDNPPKNPSYIIFDDSQREKALGLLDSWKKRTDYYPHLELLMKDADEQAQLQYWANNITLDKNRFSSKKVENTLFDDEIERLARLDPVDLCQELRKKLDIYQQHSRGFWGKIASNKIQWSILTEYAKTADSLAIHDGVEKIWNAVDEAVSWYTEYGWRADELAENIHQENPNLPGALYSIRAKLQRTHQKIVDKTNLVFSELIDKQGLEKVNLEFSGMKTEQYLVNSDRVAFVIVDALRFELGKRISRNLNEGEPVERAQVIASKSSIPTITSLGMSYALPGVSRLETSVNKTNNGLSIKTPGSSIDLSTKTGRIKWLKKKFSLKDSSFINIEEILDYRETKTKRLGKNLFVFGKDFDDEGHQGKLQITGAANLVDRYSNAVRKLRSLGYSKIIIVTDHGYFHWESDEGEIEEKPDGNIISSSRRYVIGHNLVHSQSLKLKVSGSQIECLTPRSINVYKTYGGMGFFHGGTTLQEYIVPVVIVEWPEKAKKVQVNLIPISEITSLSQRVEIEPSKVQKNLFGNLDETVISRRVFVKVVDPKNRGVLFRSKDHLVEPGGSGIVVELEKVDGEEAEFNSELNILVCDSDNEAILHETKVVLRVEFDTWY